jgi:hypothetical protein
MGAPAVDLTSLDPNSLEYRQAWMRARGRRYRSPGSGGYRHGRRRLTAESASEGPFVEDIRPTDVPRLVRRFLEKRIGGGRGWQAETRLKDILENMVGIASSQEHPQAVAAFKALCDWAYGRPRPSEEELETTKKSGIKLAFIVRSELDNDIPMRTEQSALTPKPDFVKVEHG